MMKACFAGFFFLPSKIMARTTDIVIAIIVFSAFEFTEITPFFILSPFLLPEFSYQDNNI